jgi:hypothetical protein
VPYHGRLLPYADALRRLQQIQTQNTSMSPTALLCAVRLPNIRTSGNKDALNATAKREPRRNTRDIVGELRVSKPKIREVFLDDQLDRHNFSQNARLLIAILCTYRKCNHEAPIIRSSDLFRHLMARCIFRRLVSTDSLSRGHSMESLCADFFPFCVRGVF